MYTNQYRAGIIDLTTVVTAESTLLNDQETELAVRQNLYLASVSLIEALGDGWDTTLMPTQVQLIKGFTLFQQIDSRPSFNSPIPTDGFAPPSAPALPKPNDVIN